MAHGINKCWLSVSATNINLDQWHHQQIPEHNQDEIWTWACSWWLGCVKVGSSQRSEAGGLPILEWSWKPWLWKWDDVFSFYWITVKMMTCAEWKGVAKGKARWVRGSSHTRVRGANTKWGIVFLTAQYIYYRLVLTKRTWWLIQWYHIWCNECVECIENWESVMEWERLLRVWMGECCGVGKEDESLSDRWQELKRMDGRWQEREATIHCNLSLGSSHDVMSSSCDGPLWCWWLEAGTSHDNKRKAYW